jgi:hypothetical protein
MRTALRPLFCVAAAFGLLWSTTAQAVPSDDTNQRGNGNGRGHGITLSARPAVVDFIISHLERGVGRGDDCASSLRGCARSGRVENEAVSPPGLRLAWAGQGWAGRVSLREFSNVRIEPVRLRPALTPANPIPEPQAALVFMVGIGIVATHIRRRSTSVSR